MSLRLFHKRPPIHIWRQSFGVEMCGNPGDWNPQLPSTAEKNLRPTIEPRLQNDLAEKAIVNKVPTEKERIEDLMLCQTKPKATIEVSPLIASKNSLSLLQSLLLCEKG